MEIKHRRDGTVTLTPVERQKQSSDLAQSGLVPVDKKQNKQHNAHLFHAYARVCTLVSYVGCFPSLERVRFHDVNGVIHVGSVNAGRKQERASESAQDDSHNPPKYGPDQDDGVHRAGPFKKGHCSSRPNLKKSGNARQRIENLKKFQCSYYRSYFAAVEG